MRARASATTRRPRASKSLASSAVSRARSPASRALATSRSRVSSPDCGARTMASAAPANAPIARPVTNPGPPRSSATERAFPVGRGARPAEDQPPEPGGETGQDRPQVDHGGGDGVRAELCDVPDAARDVLERADHAGELRDGRIRAVGDAADVVERLDQGA